MNIVGAFSMAMLCVGLLFRTMGEQPIGIFTSIIAIYSVFAFFFLGTARALAPIGSQRLRRGMLWANWALIAFWGLDFAEIALSGGAAFTVDLFTDYLGELLGRTIYFEDLNSWITEPSFAHSLFLVAPQCINIHALRSALAFSGTARLAVRSRTDAAVRVAQGEG